VLCASSRNPPRCLSPSCSLAVSLGRLTRARVRGVRSNKRHSHPAARCMRIPGSWPLHMHPVLAGRATIFQTTRTAALALLVVAALLVWPQASSALRNIQSQWGKCYETRLEAVNWATALSTSTKYLCCNQVGHLVTVQSAAENAFLPTTLNTWIAYSDEGGNDSWRFAEAKSRCDMFFSSLYSVAATNKNFTWRAGPEIGRVSNYTNWNTNEPSNSGGTEFCAYSIASSLKWNDINCATALNYMIEYECTSGCGISTTGLGCGTFCPTLESCIVVLDRFGALAIICVTRSAPQIIPISSP
jgi:hypothetical protein